MSVTLRWEGRERSAAQATELSLIPMGRFVALALMPVALWDSAMPGSPLCSCSSYTPGM